ncbi:uncharacterized protein LOC101852548 [Aplysia californica]|uniref:Uncharacterized protein LOC101852548 n=1 Tax=Aplysia californica TaxID=6500 RepID=A0ABM1A1V4_APLCA|nr:uncharacterized protein LOC101852548 [Aplysia californica]XP_012939126.1 uncharacterized protein LOC101852548 [Aplysia californica]
MEKPRGRQRQAEHPRSQGGDSGSGSVANGNGGQDVQVTVEHNTLCVPNGKGPTGLEEGLDNLGYSVNDARSSNRSSIEMDTLCCDVHESPVPTTPSDASSWQATTDVDTVSDPTTPIDRSPERGLSPSSRLLPNSAVHIDSKTPQSNGYTLSNNQQHGRSSPPPPSDGIDNVKLQDCNKNSKRQQQQKHKRGIRTKHEDPRKSNDTRKDNWHAREANGVRVLMTSQSEEHEFDLHSSHAVESARRNSYAAGIDVGYERDNDVSPSRSFSEDDLQRPQKFVSERNKGEINKAFIRSNDERFIEM